jgi:hypothetical protein
MASEAFGETSRETLQCKINPYPLYIHINNLLSFIEILGLGESKAGPYEKIMKLVHEYQIARTLYNESAVDGPMREKEVRYYVCSVFFHHWFLKNLDNTPNPSFGALEALTRADVAEAQGYRALQWIAASFKEKQYGGLR